MLRLIDLEVGYGRTAVVHGMTIEVPPDGVTAVLGRNGAGTTTLLCAAVGLLPARDGTIRINGEDVTALPRTSGCATGWPTCRRVSSRSGW